MKANSFLVDLLWDIKKINASKGPYILLLNEKLGICDSQVNAPFSITSATTTYHCSVDSPAFGPRRRTKVFTGVVIGASTTRGSFLADIRDMVLASDMQ